MVDLTSFASQINAAMQMHVPVAQDPRCLFLDVISHFGLQNVKSIIVGQFSRHAVDGDRGSKQSGWYIYNEMEIDQGVIGFASYGNWRTGDQLKWSSYQEHKMSIKDRVKYQSKMQEMREAQEIEQLKRQQESAKKAVEIWEAAEKASSHPYLLKKQVSASDGLKIARDGRLIVPVYINKNISSLQFIDNLGNKRFLTGGKKKAGYFFINGDQSTIYVTEGYSTAKSVAMATKKAAYVAFDAGNLYEVCSWVKQNHPQSRIIVAGDDDFNSDANIGRKKADQAAVALGIDLVFPVGECDFNDMHVNQGIEALTSYLIGNQQDAVAYVAEISKVTGSDLDLPGGVLDQIISYYNATAGILQPGFAIQSALAVCSVVLGRLYKTSANNWSNLYLLNVSKSGTGKEHAKMIVDKILYSAGKGALIGGDGYTSAGAVYSTLLRKPNHYVSIDEFGRYLEAARSGGKGGIHQREANTKLMEAISRTNGTMRPPNYSSMVLGKAEAKNVEDRFIHNPSITMLAMTTPSTLYESIDIAAVKDGFINRFLISISDVKRQRRKHAQDIDVPEVIIDWINSVTQRNNIFHSATEQAKPIVLDISTDAEKVQVAYEDEAIQIQNDLEKYGMPELAARSNELAMKLSLIVALSKDPMAKFVSEKDMIWATNYARKCLLKTIEELKFKISHSQFEADKKEILADLRSKGESGITKSDMNKTPPYSKYKAQELREILEALKEADLVIDITEPAQNRGRPTIKWMAIK